MKKSIGKSIWAGFLGMLVGAALSIGVDTILETRGVLPHGHFFVSAGLIWFVLAYRTLFNTLGCYVTAKYAPQNPMKHALIVGAIGTVFSVIGAIANIKMNLGPHWYCWTLAALSMPAAYLGGKLAITKK